MMSVTGCQINMAALQCRILRCSNNFCSSASVKQPDQARGKIATGVLDDDCRGGAPWCRCGRICIKASIPPVEEPIKIVLRGSTRPAGIGVAAGALGC